MRRERINPAFVSPVLSGNARPQPGPCTPSPGPGSADCESGVGHNNSLYGTRPGTRRCTPPRPRYMSPHHLRPPSLNEEDGASERLPDVTPLTKCRGQRSALVCMAPACLLK